MNGCSQVIEETAQRLQQIGAITTARNRLAWLRCHAIGEAFGALPPDLLRPAKKELANLARITVRTIEYDLKVYEIAHDLPEEVWELIAYCTARDLATTYPRDKARALLLAVHDGDKSLMQARVDALKEQLKADKEEGKQTTTADAILGALGPLAKIPLEQLSEADRQQIQAAIAQVLGEVEGE
jgi:hypothetical protein